MCVKYYIMQLKSLVTGYILVTLNTLDICYSVETKFSNFYSLLYLKKFEHFIILL
jgi:hypothetical protein